MAQEQSKIFEKQFQYEKPANNDWTLPAENLFSEFYQFGYFQDMKEYLNNVKSKLNNYIIEEWSAHTQRRDPAGEVPWFVKNEIKAEFVTVAWCKFFECLRRYPLVVAPHLNSLHLCEAPGAFISALNHYLYTTYPTDEIKWQWLSTSLNPYYEGNQLGRMIVDDRFMLHTLDRWLFHEDFTGDIMQRRNIEHMQQQCSQRVNRIDLITADGSIDCVTTPAEQEEVVSTLHFAEIVAALRILAAGGNFVVKKFTLFEAASVSVLYLLNCVFSEVHVCKPCTSRRGNSEVYVVCLGYQPTQNNLKQILDLMLTKLDEGNVAMPLFAKAQLPQNFLAQHIECTKLFMNYQIEAIESNILSFHYKTDRNQTRRSHTLRTIVRKEFMQRYNVQPLPEQHKILYGCKGSLQNAVKCFYYKGSYAERESLKSDGLEAQVYILQRRLNDMEKSLKSSVSLTLQEGQPPQAVELNLYHGKPYRVLNSSLFAAPPCMMFCQKINETIGRHPLGELRAECVLGNVVICFEHNAAQESYYCKQQRFFFEILNTILRDDSDVLRFQNFPFLTHFSVSILRYLSLLAYHDISISTENDEFVVSVRKLAKRSKFQTAAISDLRNLLAMNVDGVQSGLDNMQIDEEADANRPKFRSTTPSLLSVLHIKELHRNEFSESLMEYNNLLLLKKCKQLLNSFYVT